LRIKKMKLWSGYLTDLLGILAGSVILAVAMNLFLIPHQLAAGGVSGLAVILFHLLNIPIGLTIIVVNIPLFIWAYFLLGPRIVLQSLFGNATEVHGEGFRRAIDR